ncbi:Aste57867_9900 [Aphanomyces stellatus]|uniref:Aste57867_9900 protein n=1 Tax=Aphanomyces stellatus TaxID=120398 RepID=A0A485KPC4_9STRA|nr:hypothetical protein As57867_009861 [Aphanomyces stellatus]VFT86779.1 Aste57867_9900 [Aphanomyces stellatus]
MIVDAAVEATMAIVDALHSFKNDEDQAKAVAEFNKSLLPRILHGLEKRVVGPYFTGDKVTAADFYWLHFYYHAWTTNLNHVEASPADFPKLKAIATTLHACDELADYFAKHKQENV